MGLGRSKEQKTTVCFDQKCTSAEASSQPGEVNRPSRAALPGHVKFKRAGEGTGGSLEGLLRWLWRSVLRQEGQNPMK